MKIKLLFTLLLVIPLLVPNTRADITNGIVAYWPFDDGTGSSTAADATGNGNTGTLTDFSDATFSSMWVPGRFGDGILLNSAGDTNDYVSVSDDSFLDVNNTSKAFTIAAWVKLNGVQSNGAPILYKGVTGFEQYGLDITGGQFRCIIRNSSGKSSQSVSSTFSPTPGVWYHVVCIWSASPQQHYIYIDGAFNNTYSGGGFLTSGYVTNHALTIGSKETSLTSGYNVPFQGEVDDVRLYKRVLTPSDIYELYTNSATTANAPVIVTQPRSVSAYLGDTAIFSIALDQSITLFPVSYQWQFNTTNILNETNATLMVGNAQGTNQGTYTVVVTNVEGSVISSNAILTLKSLPTANIIGGLVGYWKFDDGSGSSTAADSSGNGNSGVLAGFTDTTYTTMWTNGVFNGALAFNGDGTGSNVVAIPGVGVTAPGILDFSSSPVLTVSAWVNGNATQASGAGIIAKGIGATGEEYDLDVFNGAYRFQATDTNGASFSAQTAIAPNGNWQLVTGVLNASNGILNCYVNGALAASSVAPATLQTNSHEVSIGNRPFASGVYGSAFTGIIDDVKIYNRDLTSADVSALYAAKPSPLFVTWPATNYDVVAGVTAQLNTSVAGGLAPFTYQWQLNGSNIVGATHNPLVLSNAGPAAAGSYDVVVSDGNIVPAVTSSVVTVTILPYLTFNSNGTTWSAQGSTASTLWVGSNVAQMTYLSAVQSNSLFYDFPMNAGVFQASFTYQVTAVPGGSTGPGDGVTFCLQDDPRGAAAIGYNGSALGVGTISNAQINPTITPSVEFEISCGSSTSTTTTGVSFDTDGGIGPFISTTPVVINAKAGAGDPLNVTVTYLDGLLFVSMVDTNAGNSFSTSTTLNIPSVLGSSNAYVGFTSSTGTPYAAQQVSGFTYKNVVSPVFTQELIAATNISAGASISIVASAIGNAPLSFQWLDENSNPVLGATNAILQIPALSTNNSFTLMASNPYGTNASSPVSVTVISGPPQLVQDIAPTTAVVGSTVVLSALFEGTLPITYGWQSNGVAVVSGGRISGANTSVLTINNVQASDAATYQLFATNSFSSGQSSLATLSVASTLGFNGSGSGWIVEPPSGPVAWIADQTVQMTDAGLNEANAAFYSSPVYVGGFQAAFTYQLIGGAANGTTFCLQNDPRGSAAVGANGVNLGVGGPTPINPSVELELNIYSANGIGGVGVSVNTNGAIGPTISPAPLLLNNGDPINVVLTYKAGVLQVSLSDPAAGTQYSFSTNLNISAVLGTNFAYVGFTASDGGSGMTALQYVSDFSYVSLLSPSASISGGNLILSWPNASGAYSMQQSPVLGPGAHWTMVSAIPASVNGQIQVTIPAPGAPEFYRLVLTNAPGNL
jgi:hypothetical protein